MTAYHYKVTCHICGGEDVSINGKGVLSRHRERIMTAAGVANGPDWCEGGGQEPGPDLSGERFPSGAELARERWAA